MELGLIDVDMGTFVSQLNPGNKLMGHPVPTVFVPIYSMLACNLQMSGLVRSDPTSISITIFVNQNSANR